MRNDTYIVHDSFSLCAIDALKAPDESPTTTSGVDGESSADAKAFVAALAEQRIKEEQERVAMLARREAEVGVDERAGDADALRGSEPSARKRSASLPPSSKRNERPRSNECFWGVSRPLMCVMQRAERKEKDRLEREAGATRVASLERLVLTRSLRQPTRDAKPSDRFGL